jgi:Tfp pilus assembly protein PilN
MSRAGNNETLVIGGEPTVDLLPPEVKKDRAAKAVRRQLGLAVIGVVALMIVGTGASFAVAMQAQALLASEEARTPALLQEQGKYAEVRQVQREVGLIEAAQQVAVSTEIDWKKYLESVQAILPESVTIKTVAVDSATPLVIYAQPTAPLQGPRVATLSFTAASSVLPDVPTWIDSLATLPGFADALPGSVTRDEMGVYTVEVTMHINDAAYAHRFVNEGE